MPIIIAGIVGAGIVGVIAGATHDDYSDHSDYSDYALRRRQERESKLKNEERKLSSAKEALRSAVQNAIAQMKDTCESENVMISTSDENSVRQAMYAGIENAESEEAFSKAVGKMSDVIKENVDKRLKAEIEEKQREIDDVNDLLERVTAFRLSGKSGNASLK
jgi:exonuclease VII large subunit